MKNELVAIATASDSGIGRSCAHKLEELDIDWCCSRAPALWTKQQMLWPFSCRQRLDISTGKSAC